MPSMRVFVGSWERWGRRECCECAFRVLMGGTRNNLDVRSLCLAREIMGRASGLADFALAMQGLGSAPITLYGRDRSEAINIASYGRRHRTCSLCPFQPYAGSDVGAISATATRDGNFWCSRRHQNVDFKCRPRGFLCCFRPWPHG